MLKLFAFPQLIRRKNTKDVVNPYSWSQLKTPCVAERPRPVPDIEKINVV